MTPYTSQDFTERLNALLIIEARRLLRDRTPDNIKRAIKLLDIVRNNYV